MESAYIVAVRRKDGRFPSLSKALGNLDYKSSQFVSLFPNLTDAVSKKEWNERTF